MVQLTATAFCTLVCCINIGRAVPMGTYSGFGPAQSTSDWQSAYNRLLNRKRYQSSQSAPFLSKTNGRTLFSSRLTPMSMAKLPIKSANLKSHSSPGMINKRAYNSKSWPTLFRMKWKRGEDGKQVGEEVDGQDKSSVDKRHSDFLGNADKRHSDFLGNADKPPQRPRIFQDKRDMSYIYDKRDGFKWFNGFNGVAPDHVVSNHGSLSGSNKPVNYMSGWNSPNKRTTDGEFLEVGDILSGLSRGFNKRSTQEQLDYDNLMALLENYLQNSIQERPPYKRSGFLNTYGDGVFGDYGGGSLGDNGDFLVKRSDDEQIKKRQEPDNKTSSSVGGESKKKREAEFRYVRF